MNVKWNLDFIIQLRYHLPHLRTLIQMRRMEIQIGMIRVLRTGMILFKLKIQILAGEEVLS